MGETLVVGIGGTEREGSSSEAALRLALAHAAGRGARTVCYSGAMLAELPMYRYGIVDGLPQAAEMVESVRACNGLVIASPGYHGTVSGLVKNALDYLEELRGDPRPYLDGRAVGCIAVAYGWQAAVTTLEALRSVTHALRGWPTPLGAALNSKEVAFDAAGGCDDAKAATALETLSGQVVDFAQAWRSAPRAGVAAHARD